MHISDGFLPLQWCVFWYMISIPIVAYGILKIKKITDSKPEVKPLIALSGAFMFVLSAFSFPIGGSSSHPTGSGLGAILFGPAITSVLAAITLFFQAFYGHGGITTLGANIFSMGIMGSTTAWLLYKGSHKVGLSASVGIFIAAFSGDLMTYITTGTQLALAYPTPTFQAAFLKWMVLFAPPQIILAIGEGVLTVLIWDYIVKLRPDILQELKLIKTSKGTEGK